MVTLKKKRVKRIIYLIIIILIIWGGYRLAAGPNYEDPNTAKPVFGNPEATVKVIEFADIQCPACKAAHPIITQIKSEYKDQISFEFYHFPLRSIHPYAQKAAEAVECANDQGKFFEYIDAAFAQSPNLQKKNLKIIASQLDLDTELFEACLDSASKQKVVEGDLRFGGVSNVQGTPTFFINNQPLQSWQYASFKVAIERELR